ncbi:nesprin-2 [Antennarius striatus]|uniref:nesprin-2 n=1 Tax=Antennarius striatus TaxID=241820 RepID=UPI0035AEC287
MPGFPPDRHGDAASSTEEEEARDTDLIQDQTRFLSASSLLEVSKEERQREEDGDLPGCGLLEKRWLLWHEFMKEHAHLDTWLGLVEQAVASPDLAHVTYQTAKDELRKFERLRAEAGSRLVQLDGLTRRNRTLTRMFQGAMQRRLLASARESGQRWDEANANLECVTGRLKLFVSEWEEFDAEREELALWLADLDIRLTEVDHLTGNTCEKLKQLQDFQQCVCVNSDRLNGLLRRGEALIQRSRPADAQLVENRLLELLRRCSLVYNKIARTHTRLLSMRLVFADDWILSHATDSGCPSESLLDEEGALDKYNLDLPKVFSLDPPSPVHLPPPPPSPSLPTHEHLGLEWDPSVDIGRSVSCDDTDSSYFSASTGRCRRDGLKRRSYLSSLGSMSDISNDNQEAGLNLEGCLGSAHPRTYSPLEAKGGGARLSGDQWLTSTPEGQNGHPIRFDGGRVRAWLGVQSSAPLERRSSKAVQTDGEGYLEENHTHASNQCDRGNTEQSSLDNASLLSRDLKGPSDWLYRQSDFQISAVGDEEEQLCGEEAARLLSGHSGTSSSTSPSSLLCPVLLYLLLAAALVLLACLIWLALEPPCHRSSRMNRSFHLTLRYVNGIPPT